MSTVVLRVPQSLYETLKRVAALQGRSSGEVLNEAWTQYMEANREELAASFEKAAAMIRNSDTEGLQKLTSRSVKARAAAAKTRNGGNDD